MKRALGERETQRVGAVLAYAARRLQDNLAAGQTLRTDAFWIPGPSDRSDADERIEAVLLAAQRDPEERELPLMGNLLANLAFDDVDRAEANGCIRIGERLSYRQLCLLTLLQQREKYSLPTRDYTRRGTLPGRLIGLIPDFRFLYGKGLLDTTGEVILGLTDFAPASTAPIGYGELLHELMDLESIDTAEIEELAKVLRLPDVDQAPSTPGG